jgi:site-specific DNA-methyltransferase (adenine-specific)
MQPYYQDEAVTIYHGDCREVLPSLAKVDLVLTDPPYGIADVWQGGFSAKHGWGKAKDEAELRNEWDAVKPDAKTLELIISKGHSVCIWGGNYFVLPPSRGWLVWSKPERGFTLSEAELAWTNRDAVVRVFDGNRSDYGRQHPTQKTLALMRWTLQQFKDAQTILDPFMGSGTTLRAAKDLGRKAIGIEIEERYCEIAAKRMAQQVLDFATA